MYFLWFLWFLFCSHWADRLVLKTWQAHFSADSAAALGRQCGVLCRLLHGRQQLSACPGVIASNFPSTVDSALVEESLQKADGNYTRTDEYDTGTVQYTLRLTSEEQQNATAFFDAKPTIRGGEYTRSDIKTSLAMKYTDICAQRTRRSPAAHRPLPAGVLHTRRRLYLRCGHHLKRQRQQGAPLCYEKRAGRAAKIKIPLPAGISCFSITKIRRLCKVLPQKPHQCAKNLPFTNAADRRRCDDPNFLLRNSHFFLTTSSEYANIIQQCETALPTEYRGIV